MSGSPPSDHFDGRRFHNVKPTPHGALSFFRWVVNREQRMWPRWIESTPGPTPPSRVEGVDMRVTFINHSTLLIQTGGMNILTDPVWSDRVSPVSFAGPKRRRLPGIRFEDLPTIDLVLVSHNHYDHCDLATLRRLAARDHPLILTGLGNRRLLERKGIECEEMDWWQQRPLHGARITAVPAQHFSGRGLHDRDRSLWCGFVIEALGGACYFAGDTGFGEHFAEIGRRFTRLRLALLPIGAFRPRWFMSPVHISPDEAILAHENLGALTSVAMHFGTFALGDDGETEPVEELERELAKRERAPRFWVLGFGEGRQVPAI